LLGRALRAIYRFTLRSSDRVIVMDRWMKARVEAENVLDPPRIVIVPLWPVHTDNEGIEPTGRNGLNPFRQKHGLAGKFVVAHSGNLSYIHPLDTVLDAAVRLKHDDTTVFVFIGYGAREKDIDVCIHDNRLRNIVKLPYQPRELLATSLDIADLHLVVMGNAASGRAHSSKIYSILATGRPYVFVGPRGSHIISDVLEPCGGGFHVENGEVNGLLRIIENVKRLPHEERARVYANNRAFVASRFSREACLAHFTEQVIGDDTARRNPAFAQAR
jgi:colanic acid biosynthesis glycosyl transferase WcaI